jgi:TonB family protein
MGTSATNRFSSVTLPIAVASTAAVPASSPNSVAQPQTQDAALLEAAPDTTPTASAVAGTATTASSPATQLQAQPAVLSERIAKPTSNNASAAISSAAPAQPTDAEPEPRRPSVGEVRLAKPKVKRSGRRQVNGLPEPDIEMTAGQNLPTDNSLGAGLVGDAGKQPSAPPLPVGGDVTPARMISAVPPVYPPMAKTQHISGDVRIDALIDANGRVSSMKVVSGPALLHHAAMDALRQWKYQPASLDGKPVPMHLTVTIQFHLQ